MQNSWPGFDIQQAVKWFELLSLYTEKVKGFLEIAFVYYWIIGFSSQEKQATKPLYVQILGSWLQH